MVILLSAECLWLMGIESNPVGCAWCAIGPMLCKGTLSSQSSPPFGSAFNVGAMIVYRRFGYRIRVRRSFPFTSQQSLSLLMTARPSLRCT